MAPKYLWFWIDVATAGKLCIVSGWGRNEKKKLQSQLHFLEAKIMSNVLCDSRWHAQGAARGFIVPTMMCMDSTNGDSCNVSPSVTFMFKATEYKITWTWNYFVLLYIILLLSVCDESCALKVKLVQTVWAFDSVIPFLPSFLSHSSKTYFSLTC